MSNPTIHDLHEGILKTIPIDLPNAVAAMVGVLEAHGNYILQLQQELLRVQQHAIALGKRVIEFEHGGPMLYGGPGSDHPNYHKWVESEGLFGT